MLNRWNEVKHPFKFLSYLVAINAFFFILPSILLRKMVMLPYIGVVPISILFTGVYFMLLDVLTEVYGYYEARRALYAALFVYTLFVFFMELNLHIPSPQNYYVEWSTVQDPLAYRYLFENLYLVWFSVMFCALFANTINIMILSKWKILIKGRYFWMRSITTSLFTAMIYSLVSNFFAFGLFLHTNEISYFVKLFFVSVFAKLTTLFVCAYPATILCSFLKKKEGVDIYDYNVNYNPLCRKSENPVC